MDKFHHSSTSLWCVFGAKMIMPSCKWYESSFKRSKQTCKRTCKRYMVCFWCQNDNAVMQVVWIVIQAVKTNMQAVKTNMQAVWLVIQAVKTNMRAVWIVMQAVKTDMQAVWIVMQADASSQNEHARGARGMHRHASSIFMQAVWIVIHACKRSEGVCKPEEGRST